MIFIVAHFEKTLEELKGYFGEKQLRYGLFTSKFEISDSNLRKLEKEGLKVIMFLSEILSNPQKDDRGLEQTDSMDKRVRLIVAEHYPLPGRDEMVLALGDTLPYPSTLCFHASLDEPLMKALGSERVTEVLKTLEMDGKEAIRNPTLVSAITAAQKNVKKKALGDQRCGSMEEWFRYNFPERREKVG
jgi:hypothetical protein